MRKVPVIVTVLGLAVAGCGFSTVDRNSSVSISGRALDESGKPLGNTRILLVKQADIGEVIFGSVLTVGTLSTICFAPDPPAICQRARTATTDSDGRYHFEVKGSDTQGSLGTEATMNVVFSGRSAGPSTTVSFVAEHDSVVVPDARLWDLAARAASGAGGIALSWRPLPASAGSRTSYSAQLYDARSGAVLWSQPATGRRTAIDPRLLEDRPGATAVSASTELPGGDGAGKVRASFLSERLPVRASAGAPPSRGRRCAVVTGPAPDTGPFRTPCGETDGDLSRPARMVPVAGSVATGVVVDLGRVRPVDLVVARGFSGQFLVETSVDGKAFSTVATGFGQAYAVQPGGHPAARYVRLRSPAGLDESLSSEISVW